VSHTVNGCCVLPLLILALPSSSKPLVSETLLQFQFLGRSCCSQLPCFLGKTLTLHMWLSLAKLLSSNWIKLVWEGRKHKRKLGKEPKQTLQAALLTTRLKLHLKHAPACVASRV
jgi:hypothetical protein